MSIKSYRPTTPGRRQMTVSGFDGVDKHATNHLDNPVKISAVRRDIARVKTVIREKELEQ